MICHSCGAEIPGGVNFCTYCGAEQKPVDLKVCKKCNYSNRADDTNCKKCGSNLAVEGTDYVYMKTGVPMGASSPQPEQQPQSAGVPPKQVHKPAAPVLPPFGMDKKAAGLGAPKPPIPPAAQQAQGIAASPVPGVKPIIPQPQRPIQRPDQQSQMPSSPIPPSPQFSQINHPQMPHVPGQPMPGVKQAAPIAPQRPAPAVHPQPQAGMAAASVTGSGDSSIPPAPIPQMKTPAAIQASAAPMPGVIPAEASGQFLFCDICGAKNEAELNECKYCKSPLKKTDTSSAPVQHQEGIPQPDLNIIPPVTVPKPPEEKTTGTKGKICRKCNTENPAMMLICYNCGEPLDGEKPVQKISSPSIMGQDYSSQPPIPQAISQPSGALVPLAAGEPPIGAKGEVSKKICPKCGTPNLLGSTVCGHCGFLFKNEGAFSDDTETKPFLVCPKCYFRNAVDATECAKCHTTLKILPNVKLKGQADFPIIGDSTVKCPVCGVDNPREVLSCKNCNYNFLKKKQEVIQVAPPLIPEGERVACPRCGSDNDKSEHRCKICGEKLNKQTTVEIPVYSQQKISSAAPLPPQPNVPNPPLPGNLGSGAPPAGQGVGIQPPAMHLPASHQGAKVPPSATPPPPIGAPGGGAVAEQKVQFVPDWKQGKKAASENVAQEKQAKSKGTFSKKTAMTIIFGIIAIIVIAVALIFLEKGGSSADNKSGSSNRSDNASSISGSRGISEEEITDSGTSALNTNTPSTQPSTPDLKGVQVDASKKPVNQSDISVVEDKNASEITELITKGKDAIKRGRVNYPRNNNAFYYFQQARDKGADTPEFEELKTQLSASLHTLGDKKLGERSFKDANTFYDLAAQVDPEDTSIRRKKNQVRDMQRRTEIEQNELNTAIRTQTIAELEKFVDKYPTSPLVTQAQAEIVRLKRLKQETEDREAQRKKDEDARRAYEEKQYVFNVVHSYFMGKNRGKLIINRKGVLFEPVDNKNERFYATYGQIQSFVFDDGEVVIKFNQSIGEVGDEITLKHITEAEAKTKQIFDAYDELRPK